MISAKSTYNYKNYKKKLDEQLEFFEGTQNKREGNKQQNSDYRLNLMKV